MSLSTRNTRDILQSIQALYSAEQYYRALKEVELGEESILVEGASDAEQQDILLLVANVYCANRRYREARWYIGELQQRFTDIHQRSDFIILQLKVCLKEGHNLLARRIMDNWRRIEAESEASPVIDYFTGIIQFRIGNYREANSSLQRCFRRLARSSDPVMLGNTLYMLGYVAFHRGMSDVAEQYLSAAVTQFESGKRIAMLGLTHRMAGSAAIRTGRYDTAWNELHLAISYYKECLDRKGIVDVQLERARVFMRRRECDDAERLLRGIIAAARKIRYAKGAVRAELLVAEVFCMRGRPAEALPYVKEAEKYAALASPDTLLEFDIHRNRGEAFLALGRFNEAEPVLEQALECARRSMGRCAIGIALRALGRCAEGKEDIDSARTLFDEAIIQLKEAGDSYELLSACHDAADAYVAWGHDEILPAQYRKDIIQSAKAYSAQISRLCTSHGAYWIERCSSIARRIKAAAGDIGHDARYRSIHTDPLSLHYGVLVARSRHMREIVDKVRALAPSTVPILITGETGTGKEVVARLIHRLSNRSKGPFIAVNCAAVPDPVFESELFGHKRGSFTGAVRDKKGLIEQASGGTIFLDEISELSNQQQAKLLRALQDGMIRRVGETSERPIDVRVISASNEDIEVLRRTGRLRDDFFYRISVETIELRPLKDRRDDIAAIFEYYLEKFAGECRVEESVIDLLRRHQWPGNVRELVGVARVLALIAKRYGTIQAHDLPLRIVGAARQGGRQEKDSLRPDAIAKRLSAAECKKNPQRVREIILLALAKYNGNKSAAARALGVSRCTLYRRMKELKMNEP